MLKNKNIVLCVSGGIAAYKAAALASMLVKEGANIYVIMTKNATKFITPLTFKSITRNKVTVEMFDESDFIPHISLSELADLVIVAPATANVIAKAAHGLADDMTSTILLSTKAPKIIVPAMNTNMYENPVTQQNIKTIQKNNFTIVEPETGRMACGTYGKGRYPDNEKILGTIIKTLTNNSSMFYKKRILITIGGTIEDIDPVRYITNRSSGKTGFQFAAKLIEKGAEVKIIAGNVSEIILKDFQKKYYYTKIIKIRSAKDMLEKVTAEYPDCDILFMPSAVADYSPNYTEEKIKKTDNKLLLELHNTSDILKTLKKEKNKIHIGFAAESSDVLKNAKNKIKTKGLEIIIANKIKGEESAIGTDKSELLIINKWNDEIKRLTYKTKKENIPLALDIIEELIQQNIP